MMKTALVFPGQGAQFVGMGKELYTNNDQAKSLFDRANDILGFDITSLMFEGTDESLKDTKVTQPALFLHSVIRFLTAGEKINFDAVAGHSLGEFSALVAAGVLTFEDGLKLVQQRAEAMQDACRSVEGTMAAVIGLDDDVVKKVCDSIAEVVVPANYNCPGQLVISGSIAGIEKAVGALKEKGARRALVLNVDGAFHSPLMASAETTLKNAIEKTQFNDATQAVYQNVHGLPERGAAKIKQNLIAQLTSPVMWTQIMTQMQDDGFEEFIEIGGNGKVISGLFRRFNRQLNVSSLI